MKKMRRFKDSWFYLAIVVTIVLGEVAANVVANTYGLRVNPVVVGFLCAGLVGFVTSVLYEGCDIG